MHVHAHPGRQAFTLLEVMIALTVMAIGMFAVFGSMGTTINTVKVVSDFEIVDAAMENRIEQIQAGQWAPSHATMQLGLPRTFMGSSPVTGVQPLSGQTDVMSTGFARWDKAMNAFIPLQDPRQDSDWGTLTETEKEARWADLKPTDFDILLITLRADWQSVVGPVTKTMEFVLVDRDGIN